MRWADKINNMRNVLAVLLLAALALVRPEFIVFPLSARQSPVAAPSPLTRHYREGERLSYRITATNRNRAGTANYAATASGIVRRDSAGRFFEEYQWSDIVWNGTAFDLPPANREFRQLLSLSPDYTPSLPDFSRIHPRLVGPATDLMTFYSDVWLAVQQRDLRRPGDRTVVNHGQPNSWADGTRVVLGEDAIDFVIVLGDSAARVTIDIEVTGT